MPSGRTPKPAGEAVHRNPVAFQWIEVENVPFEDAPDLPACRTNGAEWPEHVHERWSVWSRMPHCILWSESDWQFCLDTLEVAVLWKEQQTAAYCTELRSREKTLGTTADSRLSLRIRYVEPKQPTLAPVVSVDDYRNL